MEFVNRKSKKKYTEDTDKLLPQSLELEKAILGALLLDKDAITDIVDVLTPETFYGTEHLEIYTAIVDQFRNSEGIDIITVSEKLRKMGKLEFVGGASAIVNLTTKVNSAANIEYHAHLLVQYAMKRGMIAVASKMHEEAYEDTTDIFALLDEMEQALFEIASSNIRKSVVSMKDVMHEALEELESRKDKKDGLTGVPSGFSDLDRVTSGWQKTDLVIIAARPAMGKTAFVLSMARNAAIEFDTPIAFFSLEMSSVQLVNRIISAECELESEKIKKGSLNQDEWTQLHNKVPTLSEAKIFIDDTPGLPVLELRAKARRLKAQHDIKVIIIDYLQLMTAGDVGRGNREQEISYISRSLKGLAKELDVCVIALSQLSRAVETRGGDKKPQLSDLRESGAIEQDADMVCFLYRPEYYQITEYEDGSSTAGIGELIIAKHRNGSLETVKMRFQGKYIKFVNLNDTLYTEDSFSPTSLPTSDFVNDFEQTSPTILQSKMNKKKDNSLLDDDEVAPF